jgi:hypothetical protein
VSLVLDVVGQRVGNRENKENVRSEKYENSTSGSEYDDVPIQYQIHDVEGSVVVEKNETTVCGPGVPDSTENILMSHVTQGHVTPGNKNSNGVPKVRFRGDKESKTVEAVSLTSSKISNRRIN